MVFSTVQLRFSASQQDTLAHAYKQILTKLKRATNIHDMLHQCQVSQEPASMIDKYTLWASLLNKLCHNPDAQVAQTIAEQYAHSQVHRSMLKPSDRKLQNVENLADYEDCMEEEAMKMVEDALPQLFQYPKPSTDDGVKQLEKSMQKVMDAYKNTLLVSMLPQKLFHP